MLEYFDIMIKVTNERCCVILVLFLFLRSLKWYTRYDKLKQSIFVPLQLIVH